MPRKPRAQESFALEIVSPRQEIWRRIRAEEGDFSLAEITLGGESTECVRDYLVGLERAGYLATTQQSKRIGTFGARRWRLVRDVGIDAPRVRRDGSPVLRGRAQENMWRTLRMHKSDINARELAGLASTPEVPVSEAVARAYLTNLHQSTYLTQTAPGHGKGFGQLQPRYRLVINTGPKAPVVQRVDALYDPNLREVIWIKPLNEEAAIYG